MTTYLILLRDVNVGDKNQAPMAPLEALPERIANELPPELVALIT